MKAILLGAGRLGLHIAQELIAEKHDVVLIEKDSEAARKASNEIDALVINDDGSRPEVLQRAGVAEAAWFLALTGSDEVNLVSCALVAAEPRRPRTLARVENPFYSQLSPLQRHALGPDQILNPAYETAQTIARMVEQGFAEDVLPLHGGQLQLRYLEGLQSAPFIGRTLKEIRAHSDVDFLIAAVVRGRRLDIPSGDYRLKDGDALYVLGTPQGLDQLLGPIAELRQATRDVLILGATPLSEHLVSILLSPGESRSDWRGRLKQLFKGRRRVRVLESDREACKRLARSYPNLEVVQGDSTEEGLLEDIGAPKADLVVGATNSQTFNILSAQLVKTLGARKSVAVSLNDRYLSLGEKLEVDALVNVKNVVAASILRSIRRAQIQTIHDFFEDDVEIVELTVEADSLGASAPLKDLNLPRKCLVAYVLKGAKLVVPKGGTLLEAGDVVAFIVHKTAIPSLENLFARPGSA